MYNLLKSDELIALLPSKNVLVRTNYKNKSSPTAVRSNKLITYLKYKFQRHCIFKTLIITINLEEKSKYYVKCGNTSLSSKQKSVKHDAIILLTSSRKYE